MLSNLMRTHFLYNPIHIFLIKFLVISGYIFYRSFGCWLASIATCMVSYIQIQCWRLKNVICVKAASAANLISGDLGVATRERFTHDPLPNILLLYTKNSRVNVELYGKPSFRQHIRCLFTQHILYNISVFVDMEFS